MKNHLLLYFFVFSAPLFSTSYFPIISENAEWQVLHTSYPYQFQMAKSYSHQVYTLYGDTVLENVTYKKIGLKTDGNGQPPYLYFGAIREQDKKIYYRGNGYFTSSTYMPAGQAKINKASDCMNAENWDNEDLLLYDFTAKKGDFVKWGYEIKQVTDEDSVLVGTSYRRRLRLSDGEEIVEGIGSVVRGMLSSVSPMITCSDYSYNWEFEGYRKNGVLLYKSAKSNSSTGYQTVYSHRKAYFATDNHAITTLKMDSCAFLNDSVFYPVRTAQLIGNECYDPDGAGWAGRKIVFDKGWNYFFTATNDTLKIKTDAVLNESWTLYQQNNTTITATVTRWDTASVLGVLDSAKTITLHVFDPTMKPMPHDLENATFSISKKYGFTKALNFTYFPEQSFTSISPEAKEFHLIGLTNPALGKQKLNWSEVFDFQEGDEFHYHEYSTSFPQLGSTRELFYTLLIVKRENFTESIRYTREVKMLRKIRQSFESDIVTTFSQYQDTSLIEPNPAFEAEPGIPVFVPDHFMFMIYNQLNTGIEPEHYFYGNGCWRKAMLTDDTCYFIRYAPGRGMVWESAGCWLSSAYTKEQVYYKKGAKTWGIPLVITQTHPVNGDTGINIYPTLATETVIVELKEPAKCTFQLLNAQGKVVLVQQLAQPSTKIQIGSLPDGIYFYRLLNDDKELKSGKITKQ